MQNSTLYMNLVLNTVKLHAKYHGLILLFSGHIRTFGQKELIPPIGSAEKEFVYLILIFNTVPFLGLKYSYSEPNTATSKSNINSQFKI